MSEYEEQVKKVAAVPGGGCRHSVYLSAGAADLLSGFRDHPARHRPCVKAYGDLNSPII